MLKKFFGDDFDGGFMGHRLHTILAKLGEGAVVVRIRPSTSRAIKPTLLIDLEQRLPTSDHTHFPRGVCEGRHDGWNATSYGGGGVNLQRMRVFERNFPGRFWGLCDLVGLFVHVRFLIAIALMLNPARIVINRKSILV